MGSPNSLLLVVCGLLACAHVTGADRPSMSVAYTYGVARQGTDERGYVRIWRNPDGSWKVAYDLR